MIKLKKIVAVTLAAAMCLGLSMTAFASKDKTWTNKMWESEDYMRKDLGPVDRYDANGNVVKDMRGLNNVTDADGNRIDYSLSHISEGTWKSIRDEGKVLDIFEKAGYEVNDDMDFVPLATGTITIDGGVPEGGATLNFALRDLGVDPETVKDGDVIYVMQETAPGSGAWDVFPAKVVRDPFTGAYQTSVTVPRNGALVVVKVMSNGDVITLDRTTGNIVDRIPGGDAQNPTNPVKPTTPSGSNSASNPASAGTSPRTGEF